MEAIQTYTDLLIRVKEGIRLRLTRKMSESDSSTGTDSSGNLSTSATEREKLSNMTEKERKS